MKTMNTQTCYFLILCSLFLGSAGKLWAPMVKDVEGLQDFLSHAKSRISADTTITNEQADYWKKHQEAFKQRDITALSSSDTELADFAEVFEKVRNLPLRSQTVPAATTQERSSTTTDTSAPVAASAKTQKTATSVDPQDLQKALDAVAQKRATASTTTAETSAVPEAAATTAAKSRATTTDTSSVLVENPLRLLRRGSQSLSQPLEKPELQRKVEAEPLEQTAQSRTRPTPTTTPTQSPSADDASAGTTLSRAARTASISRAASAASLSSPTEPQPATSTLAVSPTTAVFSAVAAPTPAPATTPEPAQTSAPVPDPTPTQAPAGDPEPTPAPAPRKPVSAVAAPEASAPAVQASTIALATQKAAPRPRKILEAELNAQRYNSLIPEVQNTTWNKIKKLFGRDSISLAKKALGDTDGKLDKSIQGARKAYEDAVARSAARAKAKTKILWTKSDKQLNAHRTSANSELKALDANIATIANAYRAADDDHHGSLAILHADLVRRRNNLAANNSKTIAKRDKVTKKATLDARIAKRTNKG